MGNGLDSLCNAVYCGAMLLVVWAIYLILGDVYEAGVTQ